MCIYLVTFILRHWQSTTTTRLGTLFCLSLSQFEVIIHACKQNLIKSSMSNSKSDEHQLKIDRNPFEGLRISNGDFLGELEGRRACVKCGKSRKYFCYTCYVPIEELDGRLPKVKLPVKIDIIKHKYEIDGKSTSAHAAILSPEDVSVYVYPNIPDYNDEDVILIFPSYNAFEIKQLFEENYESIIDIKPEGTYELPKGYNQSTLMKRATKYDTKLNKASVQSGAHRKLPVTRAVFIDSTWNQSKSIFKDERIRRLPCVVLQNRISQFWRHQKGSPRWYLATIEAIHQFLVEMHVNAWGIHREYAGLPKCFSEMHLDEFVLTNCDRAYNGQYDDLLFFFRHMYDLIHAYYSHDDLYAYKRRLM